VLGMLGGAAKGSYERLTGNDEKVLHMLFLDVQYQIVLYTDA
jgi:hypothetical protein